MSYGEDTGPVRIQRRTRIELMNESTVGMLAVGTRAVIGVDGPRITLEFSPGSRPACTLNGVRYEAASPTALAAQITERHTGSLLNVPLTVSVDAQRLTIAQPAEVVSAGAGAVATGSAVADSVAKAESLVPLAPGSWLPDIEVGEVEHKFLDSLVTEDRWDGPLVISMPRTGSTLLGMLFLLLRDPPGSGDYVFERYIHEPAAPLFWQGRMVDSIDEIITDPLTPRDVIQESAYQFASKPLARWFLRQARTPVIFAVRHPQLAWPSRWRILLEMRLENDPDAPDAARMQHAIDNEDFSALGDVLTAVTPPDNGWLAFLSLIQCCIEDGTDFVIVDNARFRADPDAVLGQICERLGLPFDPHLTDWSDLAEIRERVVMGELARGEEYEHYYRATMDSSSGIVRQDRELLPADRFPPELRGRSAEFVTIEDAATWYHMVIGRPEAITV